MSIKCYIKKLGDAKWSKKIGTLEISCSTEMAEYLDVISNKEHIIKAKIETRTDGKYKDNKLGFTPIADPTVHKNIKKITDKTLNVGDKVICDNYSMWGDFLFERKDYDFCYEKTVNRVEDRFVYMTANSGKEFAIKMNDYLYLMDRPKKDDKVLVTKFLNGKSYVTEITERYDEEEHKRKAEEQRNELKDLIGGY